MDVNNLDRNNTGAQSGVLNSPVVNTPVVNSPVVNQPIVNSLVANPPVINPQVGTTSIINFPPIINLHGSQQHQNRYTTLGEYIKKLHIEHQDNFCVVCNKNLKANDKVIWVNELKPIENQLFRHIDPCPDYYII